MDAGGHLHADNSWDATEDGGSSDETAGGLQRQAYRDHAGDHSQSHLAITTYPVRCLLNIWETCHDINATLCDLV